ncbi:MAG TPA: ABC transporter permease [Actinomycetes bacterium]|nr:ABC transporter permease [Actinomycetes bacterium]
MTTTTATTTGLRAPRHAPTSRGRPGSGAGVLRSTRAELLRLRRWPALWITVGAELALNLLFLYVFSYVSYRSGDGGDGGGITGGVPRDSLLADMLPDAIPRVAVQGMPVFAGALVLIVGALAAGSGYGWGTVKTVTLQGPGRLAALTGTLAALAVFVVVLVAALFAMDVAVSLLVATTESQPVVWPSAGDLAQAFGGGVLVMLMWTYAGVLVGTLARGPALAVGLGLVWVLAVENLLRGVGALWSPIERVTDVLPGTAAGSLAGALGATPVSEPGGTPGVLTTLGGGQAVALLAAWVIVFVVGTGWLVRRRDIT